MSDLNIERLSVKKVVFSSVLGAALITLTALSGCASTIDSVVYSAARSKFQDSQRIHSKILSARPPYKVTWITKLGPVKTRKEKQPPSALKTISAGHYRNWSWIIRGTASVVASWRVWLNHGARIQMVGGNDKTGDVVFDWATGFARLWHISRYLLGDKPLPMQLTLTLVPDKQVYNLKVTRTGTQKVPIVIAAWFPATQAVTSATEKKRFDAYVRTLTVTGAYLERVELAAGVVATPAASAARIFKGRANESCWEIAGTPAIAAGAGFKLVDLASHSSASVVRLTASIYKRHPNALVAQELYSATLVAYGARQYFAAQGFQLPQTGTNTQGINALLGYCRAFVQYTGDVRKQPITLGVIRPAHLVPWSATESNAAAIAAPPLLSTSN